MLLLLNRGQVQKEGRAGLTEKFWLFEQIFIKIFKDPDVQNKTQLWPVDCLPFYLHISVQL